jgi:hypothetical protein
MPYSEDFAAKWAELPLVEKMGNIGSEVSRMVKWRDKNRATADRAFERMLELIDLTLQTTRNTPNSRKLRAPESSSLPPG